MLWLLVVGGQEQGRRLCVRDEGNFSTQILDVCSFTSTKYPNNLMAVGTTYPTMTGAND